MTTVRLSSGDPEPFVDTIRAAEFLSLRPRRVLDLARQGVLPGHPVGAGKRRTWRFRLSEIAAAIAPPNKRGERLNSEPVCFNPTAVPDAIGIAGENVPSLRQCGTPCVALVLSEKPDSIGKKVVALDGECSYGLAHKAVLGSEQERK